MIVRCVEGGGVGYYRGTFLYHPVGIKSPSNMSMNTTNTCENELSDKKTVYGGIIHVEYLLGIFASILMEKNNSQLVECNFSSSDALGSQK